MKKSVKTTSAPVPAGPYSQAIVTEHNIYVAGQGPAAPETGLVPQGIEAQTRQVLKNIEAILKAAGSSIENVVKVSAYLSDMADFEQFNRVYKEFFNEPYPVRTTVGVQLVNILVEVDVIAVK
ncbi:MAG: Rid family detoxifying hydrolase [Bacillota bacterium]|nr:Rid family detoxifying hydrolase [Bacillota bacterium]